MTSHSITGRDVREGRGTEVHGGGRLVSSKTPKADTMPVFWDGTRRGVHNGTPPPYAQDQANNRLESSTSQPDSTPTQGVRYELFADDKAVPFPLTQIPRILPHMEQPALSIQQAPLRRSDHDTGGATQPPP